MPFPLDCPDVDQPFDEFFQQLLNEYEISIAELAKETQLAKNAFYKFRRGECKPRKETLYKIIFSHTFLRVTLCEKQKLFELCDFKVPLLVTAPEYNVFYPKQALPHPRLFFGRSGLLQRVYHILHGNCGNMAIIGKAQTGKSWVLQYLRDFPRMDKEEYRTNQPCFPRYWLPDDYKFIFIEFRNPRFHELDLLVEAIIKQLKHPKDVPCKLEYLSDILEKQKSRVIFLFDDIHKALQSSLDISFFHQLHFLASKSKYSFILSARHDLNDFTMFYNKTSPFFTLFEAYFLENFSIQERDALFQESPYQFSIADINWITEVTQCNIGFMQICGEEKLISIKLGEKNEEWKERSLRQINQYNT